MRLLPALIGLYLVALHTSIAGMEIFGWALVLAVVVHKISRRERARVPLAWPCLALTALVGLSLLLNEPLKPFWIQFGFMRWPILLWALSEALGTSWSDAFERRLLGLWAALIGVTAVYAVFQFFTGVDLFRAVSRVDFQGRFYRATGFFSGSLTFAYVFGISCLSAILPVARRAGWPRALALTLALAVGLIASNSRGGWLGALLSGFVILTLTRPRLIPVFIGGVALAGVVLNQVSIKFNKLIHLTPEHSASVRTHLWRAYWEMFKDHPWLGWGLFQTDRLLPTYYRRLGIDEEFQSHAHNVWLQWAAGAGVFSLALYLVIAGYFLRLAWRLRHRTPWGWSILLAQLFWHAGSLTEANFFDGEVNHLIVFTWAILLALADRDVHPTRTPA